MFRVELEIHRSLLRKLGATSVGDLGDVAAKLLPAHLRFVVVRWSRLEACLTRRFGLDGDRIIEEARRRADNSLRAATRYLAKNGVANTHRFLVPMKINRDIRVALRNWAEGFVLDQWEVGDEK